MVLTVALTVIVLAFLVSGYWLNSNLEVERQGMLQVSSNPTGANVLIDGESSWLQRTNTSKVLPVGEHTITLTKDGYDTWSKTIAISEGLLYRLHYPRLFLLDRTPEQYLDTSNLIYATVSPDRESILLINNTTKWSLVRLSDEKPEPRVVDVSGIFSGASSDPDALFSSTILASNWSRDGSRAILKTQSGDSTEWVLLDVRNPSHSINLTREFSSDFSEIQIADDSANTLLAVQDGNLRKIDTSARSMSTVLVTGISFFDHFDNEVVFTAVAPVVSESDSSTDAESSADVEPTTDSDVVSAPYYVGSLKLGNDKTTRLLPLSSPAKVVISKFYDDKYLTLLDGSQVQVYRKDDLSLYTEHSLSFEPAIITVGHDGEFISMSTGAHFATLDMESNEIADWSAPSEHFGWLDDDMVYAVSDGELIVYDYDGLNRRVLSSDVSATLPVTITDNKWLYYFKGSSIVREWIVAH